MYLKNFLLVCFLSIVFVGVAFANANTVKVVNKGDNPITVDSSANSKFICWLGEVSPGQTKIFTVNNCQGRKVDTIQVNCQGRDCPMPSAKKYSYDPYGMTIQVKF